MNKKTVAKYPKLCATIKPILQAKFIHGGIWVKPCTLFTKQTK